MSIERHKKMYYFFHDIGNEAIEIWQGIFTPHPQSQENLSTPLLTINDPAEDDVFVVEEVALGGRHEELATVRVLGGKEICINYDKSTLFILTTHKTS